jgi:AcrR family transcriptional regulator
MTTSSRRQRADARRAQLLEVALEVCVEVGVEHVTMAEVAARAQVTPGLVHHYFGNRDGLVAAILDHASPRSAFAGLAESLAGRPVEEALRDFALRTAALLDERGDVVRMLLREVLRPASSLPPGVVDIQDAVLGDLSRYLDERIDAGELRPHDPRAPLQMLISAVFVLGVTRQPITPWVDGFVDVVLSGIRAAE